MALPRILLAPLAAVPARGLTGTKVIDTTHQRHGFSTWHDRSASAAMEHYEQDVLVRTRSSISANAPTAKVTSVR